MTEGIKAVIFDMDGVLIDACEWHYAALNLALAHYGVTVTPEEHVGQYNGLPTQVKLNMLTQQKGLDPRHHSDIEARKQALTVKLIQAYCRPVMAHIQALSRLRFDGLHLAVASNSIRKTVEMMLNRAGVTPWLDFCLSNEDVARAKPFPDIYCSAMVRMGVRPEETLIVEDSDHGVAAARASGARVMRVGGIQDVTYAAIAPYLIERGPRG